MDNLHYITSEAKSKKNSHLTLDERGRIQQLHKDGTSNRAIAKELGRAPNTIGNELKRGTPERKSNRGKTPSYNPKLGQKVYKTNRNRCKKKGKKVPKFVDWIVKQKREKNWSFDASVGYAKKHKLFKEEEMICTKTLYNLLHAGKLPLSIFDMPEVLSRKKTKKRTRKNVKILGSSIDERVTTQGELGHWEGDTVVGRKKGKDEVILTLAEREMGCYIAMKIPDKSAESVLLGMKKLEEEYHKKFSKIFKTITFDNGSEFSSVSEIEAWGTLVYFAHPYSSWERPVNERTNRMLRSYVKKGSPISSYSEEDIAHFLDKINGLPRKSKGYLSPEELFDDFLDAIYAR